MTQLALVMQVPTTLIYWPFLHSHAMAKIAQFRDPVMDFVMFHIHWLPCVSIVLSVTLARVQFLYSHARYMAYFGVLYMCINAFGTW